MKLLAGMFFITFFTFLIGHAQDKHLFLFLSADYININFTTLQYFATLKRQV